jgi:3'(2'), 5'-bisphosphate nucleotidase
VTGSLEQARALASADDHQFAAALAAQSAALLRELRASFTGEPDAPGDSEALRKEGDRRSHELLAAELAAHRPADAVLSEEGADSSVRLAARRVWIVDPLDGTREFGEPPRVDWAVHVALVIDGFPVAGAVALPALHEVWSTVPGSDPVPARPGRQPAAAPGNRPRLAVSRTRPGWSAEVIGRELAAEPVPLGSAGFKALAVVRGEADIYAHSGGQYEWDSCAPVAVALAHGLHASRLDGSPLTYNNANPYLPDLLIARPAWADAALRAVAGD